MEKKPIRILMLEDNSLDAGLIRFELEEGDVRFEAALVTTEEDFIRHLDEYAPDLILSDYDLPGYTGALALAEAKRRRPDTPFILVTGAVSEERAIEILTSGAKDYVMKGRLGRLVPAVQRALAEAEDHRARRKAEEDLLEALGRMEDLVDERTADLKREIERRKAFEEALLRREEDLSLVADGVPMLIARVGTDLRYLFVNQAHADWFGFPKSELIGRHISEVLSPETYAKILPFVERLALGESVEFDSNVPQGGERRVMNIRLVPELDAAGVPLSYFTVALNITERKRMEDAQLFLAQCGNTQAPGDDFFRSLARFLALSLYADCVCIDRVDEDGKAARAVALYSDGRFLEDVVHPLRGTPLGDTLGKMVCVFPGNVRGMFPDDTLLSDMEAESYAGATLWDSEGRPVGLIAVIWRKPLTNPGLAVAMLKLVAIRAAGELSRLEAQEALQKSEQRYRTLFESMSEAFYLARIVRDDAGIPCDYIYLDVNPAFERIMGLPRDQLIGRRARSIIPNLRRGWLEVFGRVVETGEPARYGNYSKRYRGYFEILAFRPTQEHFAALITDITKRKEAEAALVESRERYRELAANANSIILRMDSEGTITFFNDYAQSFFGYSLDEVLGKNVRILLPPVDSSGRDQTAIIDGIIRNPDAFEENVNENVRKSGERALISWRNRAIRNADGHITGVLSVGNDITERRRTEEALERQAELLEYAPVLVRDMDDRIVLWNKGMERMYGFTREEAMGKVSHDLLQTKRTATLAAVRSAIERKGRWEGELEHRRKDGRKMTVASLQLYHRDAKGQPAAVIEVNQDITRRKKAEGELRESGRRWETTLSSIGDAVIAADREGRVTFMNAVAEKMTGWLASEAVSEHVTRIFNIVDEQTRERSNDPVERVLREGCVVGLSGHTVLIRKDGTEIPIDDSGAPIQDEKGGISGVVIVFRDITETRQAQAQIEHLASFPMLNPGPITEVDRGGVVRFMNPAAEALLPDLPILGWEHPWLADWRNEILGHFHAPAEPREREVRIGADWYSQTLYRESELGTIRIYGRLSTKRKRLESFNRSLNQISTSILSMHDADEIMNHACSAAAQVLGCDSAAVSLLDEGGWTVSYGWGFGEEVAGLRTNDAEDPHARLAVRNGRPIVINDAWGDERVNRERMKEWNIRSVMVVPVVREGEAIGVIFFNHRKEGLRFGAADLDFAGGLSASISLALANAQLLKRVLEELTERRRAEEELEKKAALLEDANRELESFSYSVSHDLRAPLRAVEGYSRMILKREGERFDNETRRQFDAIRDGAKSMNNLIEDLLALSRLGRQSLRMRDFDLRVLVEETWRELQDMSPVGHATLTIGDLPGGRGDRGLLKQVFVNLLGNAAKFTRMRKGAVIEVGAYEQDGESVCYVKDNGVGFDMRHHDRMFGVFQRLHGTDEYEGTGIGLAIVQRIIHRHGGRVWAEGQPGEGAVFHFTVPKTE